MEHEENTLTVHDTTAAKIKLSVLAAAIDYDRIKVDHLYDYSQDLDDPVLYDMQFVKPV